MGTKREEMHVFDYIFCGACGGILNVLVGYPLDTIKIKLQTMPVATAGKPALYNGGLDCAQKILRSEGVRGFYKGITAPMFSVTPSVALGYLGFGIGKWIFGDTLYYLPAGSTAGAFYTSIMVPTDRIKSLLQVQGLGRKKEYANPRDAVGKLMKTGGLRSIYKGFGLGLGRELVGSAVFFSSYQVIKLILTDQGQKPINVVETILAGGLAGMCTWMLILPIDIVKSRFQTAPEGVQITARTIIEDLIRNEGWLAFYKGLKPVLIRAFPANAACFVGFEYGKVFLDKMRGIEYV